MTRHGRWTWLAVPSVVVALLTGCGVTDDGAQAPADGADAPADGADAPADGSDALADGADAADDTAAEDGAGQRYPDVVDAELEATDDAWRLDATLSSPYDGPDRYADAFRAVAPDDEVLGVRELLHDHANEQPFTRSLADLTIPEDVDVIIVEGRDLEHGWGGDTVELEVPR